MIASSRNGSTMNAKSPIKWVEDDRWVERGEFDRQQEGWKMTAEWGGVRMTAGWRGESLTASSVSAYRETSLKS